MDAGGSGERRRDGPRDLERPDGPGPLLRPTGCRPGNAGAAHARRSCVGQGPADVAETVDPRVDLGAGHRRVGWNALDLCFRGGSFCLCLVDRFDDHRRVKKENWFPFDRPFTLGLAKFPVYRPLRRLAGRRLETFAYSL
jgi:hypothetical protein